MSEHSTSTRYFVASLAALAIVVGIYVRVQHRRAQPRGRARQPMTAAENAYLSEIEVTDPKMSTASNFLGDKVYYLDGHLVNKGPRTVRELDLSLSFMDPFGEVVLRRTERPITHQTAPLGPGGAQQLHLIFEQLPDEWNQGPPVITPAYASFR